MKQERLEVHKQYNNLYVLSHAGSYFNSKTGKASGAKYLCRCDCGDENYYRASAVKRGLNKRCLHCSAHNRNKTIIVKGNIFTNLTVIGEEPFLKIYKDGTRQFFWLCECVCGFQSYYRKSRLNTGKATECLHCAYKKRPQSTLKLTPIEKLYGDLLRSGRNRNYEVTLTIDECGVLVNGDCTYCGTSPRHISYVRTKQNQNFYGNGIDRRDNTKGYTLENSVSCCKNCNSAKSTLTEDEFSILIAKIYNHYVRKR